MITYKMYIKKPATKTWKKIYECDDSTYNRGVVLDEYNKWSSMYDIKIMRNKSVELLKLYNGLHVIDCTECIRTYGGCRYVGMCVAAVIGKHKVYNVCTQNKLKELLKNE